MGEKESFLRRRGELASFSDASEAHASSSKEVAMAFMAEGQKRVPSAKLAAGADPSTWPMDKDRDLDPTSKSSPCSMSDDALLLKLGIRPELSRVLGLFSNFAVSFSIVSILTGW